MILPLSFALNCDTMTKGLSRGWPFGHFGAGCPLHPALLLMGEGMILRILNWEKFQHYKVRRPPWIKLHHSLLDDYAFHCSYLGAG